MFLFSKKNFTTNFFLLLMLYIIPLHAEEYSYTALGNRFYIGGFGGGLYSNSSQMIQTGTAFLAEELGGPLPVNAKGYSEKNSTGFGGIEIGYQWLNSPYYLGYSNWAFTFAAEGEAYWYRHTKRGELFNLLLDDIENDFLVTLPLNMGIYLLNGLLSLHSCSLGNISPYIGGGIGIGHISIHHAYSLQIAPLESGINHFNSNPRDTSWAFTAQAKAGLRYHLCHRLHLFGEYRFLYLDSSRYFFGATVDPTHPYTSPWNVKLKNSHFNGFAFGLQFDI